MTSAQSPDDTRASRADLIPEEKQSGSEIPERQAAEILKESEERTEYSSAAESPQSRKWTSEQAT